MKGTYVAQCGWVGFEVFVGIYPVVTASIFVFWDVGPREEQFMRFWGEGADAGERGEG
jgi:hypothetical protein